MDHTISVELAPGEPSEQFFLHFNVLLSKHILSAQGTEHFLPEGTLVSVSVGMFRVQDRELAIEWRVTTNPTGGILSVLATCSDADASIVASFADDLVRSALVSALSDKRHEYIHRRLLSYTGAAALSGEFWLPGFRFAPAIANEDGPHRTDFERIVVIDFTVRAADEHQSAVLGSQTVQTLMHRLSLILQLSFAPIRYEWVWVLPDRDGQLTAPSERRAHRFFRPEARIAAMPRKGELCTPGVFAGSIADPFPDITGQLINLPTETRALLRLAGRAPRPEALAIDACARMYSLSLAVERHSRSAAIAYRVAAIDAIVSATKPAFNSVTDFLLRYCVGMDREDAVLDFMYRSVRSAHFHGGSAPLDQHHQIPFHPLRGQKYFNHAQMLYRAESIIRRAIGGWLCEIATREPAG